MTHVRNIGLALVVALALPAAALAGPYPPPSKPSTTQKAPKGPFHTLHRLQEGLQVQDHPVGRRQGEGRRHGQGQERHLPRGRDGPRGVQALPQARRQPQGPVEGRPRRHAGQEDAAPERRARRRRQPGDDQRLHRQALQRQRLLRRQRHRLRAQPPQRDARRRLRDLRLQLDRRRDGELPGVLQQRLGLLHRPDAQADHAGALDRPQRQVVRQRPRLLGHQHALRDDHEVAVVQQRLGHRPQRAGLREVRAAGGQRHHRQRHLLEQLQLLRGRAVQAQEAGDQRAVPGRRRRPALRRSPRRGHQQPHLRQLPRRRGRDQADPAQAGRRGRPHRQPGPRQPVRARRGRPQRPRAVLRRQRVGQLLRAQRRRARRRRPADGSTFAPCPFTGANAFNAAAQNEAINWSVGDPTHEAFWIRHPHAAKAGLTPLEHYKK